MLTLSTSAPTGHACALPTAEATAPRSSASPTRGRRRTSPVHLSDCLAPLPFAARRSQVHSKQLRRQQRLDDRSSAKLLLPPEGVGPMTIRVLIADDHAVVRQGLRAFLSLSELNSRSRTEAALHAMRVGLVPVHETTAQREDRSVRGPQSQASFTAAQPAPPGSLWPADIGRTGPAGTLGWATRSPSSSRRSARAATARRSWAGYVRTPVRSPAPTP